MLDEITMETPYGATITAERTMAGLFVSFYSEDEGRAQTLYCADQETFGELIEELTEHLGEVEDIAEAKGGVAVAKRVERESLYILTLQFRLDADTTQELITMLQAAYGSLAQL